MSFWTTWDTVFPDFSYKMRDPNGTSAFVNSGGQGNLLNDTGGGHTYSVGSPLPDDSGPTTDLAVTFDGSGSYAVDTATIWFSAATQGVIVAVLNPTNFTTQNYIFDNYSSTGPDRVRLYVQTDGTLRFQIQQTASHQVSWTSTATLTAGVWNIVAVRQKADTTGVELYINSATPETPTGSEVGTAIDEVDGWFNDAFGGLSVNTETIAVARRSSSAGTTFLTGSLAAFGVDDTAPSDAQMTSLMNDSGVNAVSFASKTIRRMGRRLYSPNI
jgi:hypothetical protein